MKKPGVLSIVCLDTASESQPTASWPRNFSASAGVLNVPVLLIESTMDFPGSAFLHDILKSQTLLQCSLSEIGKDEHRAPIIS